MDTVNDEGLRVTIQLKPGAWGPEYQSNGASGADLRAFIENDLAIASGSWALIDTGIIMAIPQGWEAQVRSRSGLALKHGITCLNSPGTIDCDYRGELRVILMNLGREAFIVRRGDRIAQLVFSRSVQACFAEGRIGETERGQGGFGSTGV